MKDKLYATISNSRANNQIVINLKISNRELANIVLKTEGDSFTLEYFEVGGTRSMRKRRVLLDSGLVEIKDEKESKI